MGHLHGKAGGRAVLGPVVVGGVDADARLDQQHGAARCLGQLEEIGLRVDIVEIAEAQSDHAACAHKAKRGARAGVRVYCKLAMACMQ